jgi:hypothetical protein
MPTPVAWKLPPGTAPRAVGLAMLTATALFFGRHGEGAHEDPRIVDLDRSADVDAVPGEDDPPRRSRAFRRPDAPSDAAPGADRPRVRARERIPANATVEGRRISRAIVSNPDGRTRRLPRWVPYVNVVARPLLAAGVPMGPTCSLRFAAGRPAGREQRPSRCARTESGGASSARSVRLTGCATCELPAARRSRLAAGERTSLSSSSGQQRPPDSSATCSRPTPVDHALATGSFETSTRSTMTIRSKLPGADPSSRSTPPLLQRAPVRSAEPVGTSMANATA